MTKKEHELMMALMAMLYQMIVTMFEILKSRVELEQGDIRAFAAIGREGISTQDFQTLYREAAEDLGLNID